ncbi:adenylate/guanylate cyclase domain-containing protein [Reyranella soli]|uniref:ATPase n=1 Tax=Reyranella soli TaxID=1230389 RepID=A0A512N6P9_9HYPH|nr:adenylate/guanylate cyclase domain-containing protein [Reyranella soli]GEP54659.1 ATPase [Reyranella soli]
MSIACPHCGETDQSGQFCDSCGKKLEKTCRACSASNRPNARFCANCGTPFETTDKTPAKPDGDGAQQKQVTILFADICGSTELVSRMDAEDANHALGSVVGVIVEALVRFGGVVNRQMGDGVMALFGAPVAIEDHAARACFAALAALEAVGQMGDRTLPIRIGISSGPVILRRTGRDEEDYDVAGITAHIAARLEQQAEPLTVLLSPETANLVTGIAEVESVGRIALKGIAEPLPVFRLLSATDRPSWMVRSGARVLSTFVGRDEELAQLAAALERASTGHAQAVALVADAGMGKSRLLHEFLDGLPQGAWHAIRVETTAQSTAIPYFLITALLREFVGCSQDDSTAEVAARLPTVLASLGLDAAFDTTPLLAHLDREVDDVAFGTIDHAQRNLRLVRSLRPILQRYADLHPLILVVEDYHWLDASSIEVLTELFTGLDGARIALLITTRPERRPGWPLHGQQTGNAGITGMLEIDLKHLAADHADRILKGLIGDSDELAPLRAHIISRADGTPLFLEEFGRSLHESGALANGPPPLESIVIPASVQSILAARIDRLSSHHRRILQIAAVIGRDVQLPLLAAVTDMRELNLAQEIGVLRAAGFLVEINQRNGLVHSFSHALTQSVAYDTLLRSVRRGLHGRVLRALEALNPDSRDSILDRLAHHAIQAEAWPEVARYALAAGERASRRSALTEARAYLESAIAALDRLPPGSATITQGIDARLSLRGVLILMNDTAALQEHLKEADKLADRAGDRLNLARIYISRGAILSHSGDLPGATELSRTALDIMTAGNDSLGIVSATFALAQALWYSGDFREAREVLMANVGHARGDAGQQRSTATFVLPSVVFFCFVARVLSDLGDNAAAFAAIKEAGAIADKQGHTFDQLLVNTYEGSLLLSSGQRERSVAVLEQVLGAAQTNKVEWHFPMIAALLGSAYVDDGRHADARALLERGAAFADRSRHIGKRLLCCPPLVRALAEGPEGDPKAAKSFASLTLREATTRGFRPVVVRTQLALAHVHALEGEPERAQEALRDAATLAEKLGLLREELEARERLSSLLRQHGQTKPAFSEMQAASGLRMRLAALSGER